MKETSTINIEPRNHLGYSCFKSSFSKPPITWVGGLAAGSTLDEKFFECVSVLVLWILADLEF